MDKNLEAYTDLLVREYINYQGGTFIIISDNASLRIGESVANSAIVLVTETEKKIQLLNLDGWRKGKPLTSLPQELKQNLESALEGNDKHHNVVLYTIFSLDGERPMVKESVQLVERYGKVGGLPKCTADVLMAAFHPDNNPDFSEELHAFMLQEKEISISCDRGTKLTITMDHDKYTLVNSNGILIPGKYANPIPAEVYAHPVSVDGRLVITGSYGPLLSYEPFIGNFKSLVDALDTHPIEWEIEGGKIVEVRCNNDDIQKFVRKEVFEKDTEYGRKIGEVGLPANLYVLSREITGNLMIDEKGRVHIANGSGYQNRTGCEYDTFIHGDGLVACATLISHRLNKPFMVNNVYSPEMFKTLRKK